MDKMLLQNPFLTRAVEQEYCPSRSSQRERERERDREIQERNRTRSLPPSCTVRSRSSVTARGPRCGGRFLLLHGPPPFSRDCTYLHGIPNGDSPIRARVSLDLAVTDVSQSKRRKNAHLGGCPVEFLAAVLQSRHSPLVSESILCIPWRSADGLLLLFFLFRINIKIRASLRHAAATRYPRESTFSRRDGRGEEEVARRRQGWKPSTYDNFITVITR